MKSLLNFNVLFSNLFGIGFMSACVMFGKITIKFVKRIKKENESLKTAVKSLLYNEIFVLCNYHIKNGYITSNDYSNLYHLYTSYVSLGGTSLLSDLMERVKNLEMKEVKQ